MDAKKYAEFIRCIELQEVFLVKSNIQKDWVNLNLPPTTIDLKSKPKLIHYDETNFIVRVNFSVTAKTNTEETAENIMTIAFSYDLIYSIANFDTTSISQNAKKEILNLFCNRNVPINIWPYAREFISSMTVRMGFPALVIGTRKTV